ncbi:MAG: glycosyltransferase [Casimicrobium sp.]
MRSGILFLEALSIGHVSRALAVAELIRKLGVELIVAVDNRFKSHFANFVTESLYSISENEVYGRFVNGDVLYNQVQIAQYVSSDRTLIERIQPAFVVAEFRPTALALARSMDIPAIALLETSLHPNFDPRDYSVPDAYLPRARAFAKCSEMVIQSTSQTLLGALVRNRLIRNATAPWARAFDDHGLDVPVSFFELFANADLCLISDHHAFLPVKARPQDLFLPGPWWYPAPTFTTRSPEKIRRETRHVYLASGTQSATNLEKMLRYARCFADAGWSVLFSTGNREVPRTELSDGIEISPFVDEDAVLPRVDLMIHPGGQGTIYRCLRHSVPQVILPSSPNQHFYADAVRRHGLGKYVRRFDVNERVLLREADEVVLSSEVARSVRSWRGRLQAFDSALMAERAIRSLLAL